MVTSREPAEAWHTLAVEEAARRLRTDVTRGLSTAEAAFEHRDGGDRISRLEVPAVKHLSRPFSLGRAVCG